MISLLIGLLVGLLVAKLFAPLLENIPHKGTQKVLFLIIVIFVCIVASTLLRVFMQEAF